VSGHGMLVPINPVVSTLLGIHRRDGGNSFLYGRINTIKAPFFNRHLAIYPRN